MTKEEMEQLYRSKILPENKAPYHFGKPQNVSSTVKAYNPMCGDKFHLYPTMSDSTVKAAHFDGFGCAISKASTSILAKKVEGKSLDQIESLCELFLEAVDKGDSDLLDDEELAALAELKNFEGRVDCIKLSWQALLEDLKKR